MLVGVEFDGNDKALFVLKNNNGDLLIVVM